MCAMFHRAHMVGTDDGATVLNVPYMLDYVMRF